MRKVCLLMLIIMTLLLTSCSSGDSNMVRDLFKKNERETANERFEALIGAIQNQDRVALKAFFSEKSLKESQNIEETITALFDYFRGDMLSYNDWGSLGSIGGMNEDGTGRYWKCLYATYDVETTQDKYRFAMEYMLLDTADADNVGIRSLYIIRLADDTDPQFAYRGDEKYTPGIATVYKGNIIKNLIMDCQSYTKYRPNETTGGIFVSWRRKEELPTGA